MKEKIKEFVGDHLSEMVMAGGMILIAGVWYHVGMDVGLTKSSIAVNYIADVTPELTFGEFREQIVNKTFDIARYK